LPKTTFSTKIGWDWATGSIQKIWDPIRTISATVEAINFKFGTQLGFGTSLPKKRLIPKLAGSGPGEHPKNNWDPLLISAAVKLATSNLVTNFGLGLAYKNWRGSGPGEHPKKNSDPLRIFATVEVSYFKFGTQIGFGTILPKTTFRTKIGGSWTRGASETNLGPLFISATVETNDSEIGTQHEFRFTLPNTSFRIKLGKV